jgi:hypothetical protein
MSESGILIVHMREAITEDALRLDLVRLLDLAPADLVPLDEITETSLVPYKVYPRRIGFHTTLELYVGNAPASVPKSDLGLAMLLARHYAQDVLISPPADVRDPYLWDLVSPAGTVTRVREVPTDEADGVVIGGEPDRS